MAASRATRWRVVFELDPRQCVGCAVCADVCPTAALPMTVADAVPAWIESECNGCRRCQRECPTEAIVVRIDRPE